MRCPFGFRVAPSTMALVFVATTLFCAGVIFDSITVASNDYRGLLTIASLCAVASACLCSSVWNVSSWRLRLLIVVLLLADIVVLIDCARRFAER